MFLAAHIHILQSVFNSTHFSSHIFYIMCRTGDYQGARSVNKPSKGVQLLILLSFLIYFIRLWGRANYHISHSGMVNTLFSG